MALALVTVLVAIVASPSSSSSTSSRRLRQRAVGDLAAQLEREPFSLSVEETEDLRSPLEESWRGVGYAASGVQAGAGIVAGFVLAVAMLYFILRDGEALWAWTSSASAPRFGPRSTAPAGGRGMSSPDSSAAPPRSRRSTQS